VLALEDAMKRGKTATHRDDMLRTGWSAQVRRTLEPGGNLPEKSLVADQRLRISRRDRRGDEPEGIRLVKPGMDRFDR
jgi:hypothetical protein